MKTWPSSSMTTRSPVRSHPSASIIAAVGVRATQVAGHRLRPAHPQLATLARAEIGSALRIDHAQLGAGHRPPHRARSDRQLAVGRGRRRGGLGEPVAEANDDARQALAHCPLRSPRRSGAPPATTSSIDDRSWASTAGCPASAAMTAGGTMRTVARWRSTSPRKGSNAKRGSVTTVAPEPSARRTSVMTKPMTWAKGATATIVSRGRDLERAARLDGASDEVGVGEHHALGQAGRAARVGQQRHGARGSSATAGAEPSASTSSSTTPRPRRPSARPRAPPTQRRHRGEDRRPAVHQLRGQLALGAHRAHPGDRGARRHRAERGDGPFGRVGRPDREHVARRRSPRAASPAAARSMRAASAS